MPPLADTNSQWQLARLCRWKAASVVWRILWDDFSSLNVKVLGETGSWSSPILKSTSLHPDLNLYPTALTNRLPLPLQRRRNTIVVGQLTPLAHSSDDNVVLCDAKHLIDENCFQRIVFNSTSTGSLLVLEREGLESVDEINDVFAADGELADAHEQQARCRGLLRHGRRGKAIAKNVRQLSRRNV